jgi:hypothetical protein
MMMVIEAGWCRPSLGGCSGLHAAELTGLDPAGWSRTAIVSRDLADAQDRQPWRCPDPPAPAVTAARPCLPDHRHRAVSVVDALLADRPEQQFAEAAAAAGADYQ